jgi:predicted DNA-binding protein (MmcQ/YjbR family)
MDIETLREYCLKKKDVEETFPFGDTVLVFKVRGKMFLLVSLDNPVLQFNVKCDPEQAIEWREQ